MFTKKEEETPVEKPRVYDYGSIEIPEPVSGMGGRSETSLELVTLLQELTKLCR